MNATMINTNIKFLSPLPNALKSKGKIHPRSQFTPDEDEKLANLVHQYGDDNWEDIATLMKNRNIRQCKERWLNYLAPNVKNSPWTQEEDDLLEELYCIYGPKWVKIAQMIDGRTDINVKNRYLLIQRRKNKNEKRLAKIKAENEKVKKENCEKKEEKELLNFNLFTKNEFFYDEIMESSYDVMNEWDIFNFDS